MVKGFHEDRWDALVALYGYFLTQEGGRYVSVFDLKRKASLLQSTAYISFLLESLRDDSFLDSDVNDDDSDIYTFTNTGILKAEEEVIRRGLTLDEFEASFTARTDSGLIVETNSPDVDAARKALSALQHHLRTDNDLGLMGPEEREVAIAEVAELEASLSKPTIRTTYLWTKGNEVLMWIVEKGAGVAVGELAKTALKHIHSFINVFFN